MNGADSDCPLPVKVVKGNSAKIQNLISVSCRYVVGAVFLMAGVSKIVNLREFESQVLLHSNFPQLLATLIPSAQLSFRIAQLVVVALPWLELTCGLCLIFKWAVKESATVTALLLSLFIVQTLANPADECHCFFLPMAVSSLPIWSHVLRDVVLLIGSLYLIFRGVPKNVEA
jgi:uncharacterized membrane protein YphA (DoxX/SURF4 family)